MAAYSKIEWTDATWNPIRAHHEASGRTGWHCQHVSEGCRYCYAETMNKRLGTGIAYKPAHATELDIFLDEKTLVAPLSWRKPRKIFVCSMTDLFGEWVKDEWIDQMFAVMALCPQHTFQLLSKRPSRMREYIRRKRVQAPEWVHLPSEGGSVLLPYEGGWPTNVWLGISCEGQATFDERMWHLQRTPARVIFLSLEPLLGEIFLRHAKPDWVICGGESGPHARPMHPDWVRSLRDQCAAAGVPFFFKQWGEFSPGELKGGCPEPWRVFPFLRVGKKRAGRLLDGVEHNGTPQR